MTLSNYLKSNNLNWVRLFLASTVIVGHSYAVAPNGGNQDVVTSLTGFTYSGALAVKIFFFISGLLVTNSLINNESKIKYIISRFFRIFPALLVLLIVTCFVVGPIVTVLPIEEYFDSDQVVAYFFINLNLWSNPYYELPGVFENNHYPNAVNGSLWTLNHEVKMYMFLLSISMLGILKNKLLSSFIFLSVIFIPIFGPDWYFNLYSSNSEVYYLPVCFSFGCFLVLWREKISININLVFGFMLMTWLLKGTPVYHLMFYLSAFLVVILMSCKKYINIPGVKFDISYGVYIYGFLIQQLINYYFPEEGFLFNAFVSLCICYPVAYLSWKIIEEPSIKIGKKLINKLNPTINH